MRTIFTENARLNNVDIQNHCNNRRKDIKGHHITHITSKYTYIYSLNKVRKDTHGIDAPVLKMADNKTTTKFHIREEI